MLMDVLTLDIKGTVLAVVIALIMLYFGGPSYGPLFVLVMVFFLVLSAIATGTGKQYKEKRRLYQETRSIKNVLANGLGPLIFAFFYFFTGSYLYILPFLASAASVTADKFNSEIGVLDGTPTSIITLKKIKKGESGGVTWLGLLAGLFAAAVVALFGAVLYLYVITPVGCGGQGVPIPCILPVTPVHFALYPLIVAVALGGAVGSLVDSYFGYFEEKGWGSKYSSNFICSIAGGFASIVIYIIMVGAL